MKGKSLVRFGLAALRRGSSPHPGARPRRRSHPCLYLERLDERTLLDVGDTLGAALPTGIGLDASQFVQFAEQVGDGPFGTGDVDLYRLQASAGSGFVAETSRPANGPSVDTFLRLFDAQGVELAFDDNSGTDRYSRLEFVFSTGGTYFVGVSGFANRSYDPNRGGSGSSGDTGAYRLEMSVTSSAEQQTTASLTRATATVAGGRIIGPGGNAPLGGPGNGPGSFGAVGAGPGLGLGPGLGGNPLLPTGRLAPSAGGAGPGPAVNDNANRNGLRTVIIPPKAEERVTFLLGESETLRLAQTLRSNFLNLTEVTLVAAQEGPLELFVSDEANDSTMERLTTAGITGFQNPLLRLAQAQRQQVADLLPVNASTPAFVATLMTGSVETEAEKSADVAGGGDEDAEEEYESRRATQTDEAALLDFLAGLNAESPWRRPRTREELLGLAPERAAIARGLAALEQLFQEKLADKGWPQPDLHWQEVVNDVADAVSQGARGVTAAVLRSLRLLTAGASAPGESADQRAVEVPSLAWVSGLILLGMYQPGWRAERASRHQRWG
jgi:hypothetical protein